MKTISHVALLTNIPAPYRVPVWNHLARLRGGTLEVRFISTSDARRRTWKVPASEMHFRRKFLDGGPKGGVSTPPPTTLRFDEGPSGPEATMGQGLKPNPNDIPPGRAEGQPCDPADCKPGGHTLPAALVELRAAFAMLRFLARRRPRAVICGGYNSLAAWASVVWCKVARRRFVLWLEPICAHQVG